MTCSRSLRLGQLGRLLAQLGGEQVRVGEQLGRVAAGRRLLAALGQRARQPAEAGVLAPAGAGVEVAEAGAGLADDEARAVAVAVEVDAQQLLGGAAGLALDPQAAASGTGRCPSAGAPPRGSIPCEE